MDLELRHLRALVAVVDTGTFTDAALRLGVTQSSVSRSLAGLEAALGVQVLRRSTRSLAPTTVGLAVLERARSVLAEVEVLRAVATSPAGALRVGYAWASLGRHTAAVQRRWTLENPTAPLSFALHHTPTAGLAEGLCDIAVVRTVDRFPTARFPADRFVGELVWHERRFAALSSDDPLARRRSLVLADLVDRRVCVNARTGTTSLDLWPAGARPSQVLDVDGTEDWLTAVAAGQAVGLTAEATSAHHRRVGVTYRWLRDAPRVPVHLVWRRDAAPAGAERFLDLVRSVGNA